MSEIGQEEPKKISRRTALEIAAGATAGGFITAAGGENILKGMQKLADKAAGNRPNLISGEINSLLGILKADKEEYEMPPVDPNFEPVAHFDGKVQLNLEGLNIRDKASLAGTAIPHLYIKWLENLELDGKEKSLIVENPVIAKGIPSKSSDPESKYWLMFRGVVSTYEDGGAAVRKPKWLYINMGENTEEHVIFDKSGNLKEGIFDESRNTVIPQVTVLDR